MFSAGNGYCGAGSDGWYRHLVALRLRARGHDVVAPDLPCDDDTAGLVEYAGRQLVPDEMAGGHLPALAHPDELEARLERYRAEV